MEILFNQTFKQLLEKFNLPVDLNFKIQIPADIEQKLKDKIVINEFGIGLANTWTPNSSDNIEHQSFHEDNENHFHVDWCIDNASDKQAFEFGVRTIIELAKRFQKENITNIQLTYSLQTPEMSKIQATESNIDEDEFFISDRLSFHTKRNGQIVVDKSLFDNKHQAFLTIDI